MHNDKICWPRLLKNIAYVIIPIICIILIVMIICLSYPMEREAINKKENFLNTRLFAEQYTTEVFSAFSAVRNWKLTDYDYSNSYDIITEEEIKNNDQIDTVYIFYDYIWSNVKWLIVDKQEKKAFTNIEYSLGTETIEGLINQISSNGVYWNYDNSNINTTIAKLNNVNYIDNMLETENLDNYSFYTSLLDPLEYPDQIYQLKIVYNALLIITPNAMYLIPILIIILIALIPVIILGIGRKKGTNKICLNWFDRILIEIAFLISIFVGSIGVLFMAIVTESKNMLTLIVGLTFVGIGLLLIYFACIMFFETIVKRLKTHMLIKTTFIYWVYIKFKKITRNMRITNNFLIYFLLYLFCNLLGIGITMSRPFLGIIILAILNFGTYKIFTYRIKSYNLIKRAIDDLYKGQTDIKLEGERFAKEDQYTAKAIEDIAGGLSNALTEKLKSERLKTELITNVSHDIKTPLTSIVNYVDLLKKSNIEDEKLKEYLNILDNKSQRLKKLTEDLVEASKASSGAIKLNIEKLNVNELIKQISGEFEDKFKSKNLEEIITFSNTNSYIEADSRYMYRVLENMYSNISKYALEGTRVYIDILNENDNVIIKLKNVSKQKLNITTDELMQRFVRGDASRNTEGSGLGLSIAKSLTEIQNGKFNIYLDGDLFKVTIEFKEIKNI